MAFRVVTLNSTVDGFLQRLACLELRHARSRDLNLLPGPGVPAGGSLSLGDLKIAKADDTNRISGLKRRCDVLKRRINRFGCRLFRNVSLFRYFGDKLCFVHGFILSLAVFHESLTAMVNNPRVTTESLTTQTIITQKSQKTGQNEAWRLILFRMQTGLRTRLQLPKASWRTAPNGR